MANGGLNGLSLFRAKLVVGTVSDPIGWVLTADAGDYWHAVVRKGLETRVGWIIETLTDPDQIRPSIRKPGIRRSYFRLFVNQFGVEELLMVVVQATEPKKAKLHTAFLLEEGQEDTYCKGEVFYERG